MEFKDYAAFGGLSLGIINLFLYLYKEFLRKGKLQIIHNELTIKPKPTNFDFQLDLKLRALNENISINEIFLENERNFTGYDDTKSIELRIPIEYKRISIEKLSPEMTEEQVSEQIRNSNLRITDLKIEKNSNKSLSFIDRISNVRYLDGFDDTPTNGWRVRIKYDDKTLMIPLKAEYLK